MKNVLIITTFFTILMVIGSIAAKTFNKDNSFFHVYSSLVLSFHDSRLLLVDGKRMAAASYQHFKSLSYVCSE